MMFREDLLKKVLSGEKTQTRRVVKVGQFAFAYDDANYAKAREYCVEPLMLAGNDGLRHVRTMQPHWWINEVMEVDRRKWLLNNDYAIQGGRGKPAVARFKIKRIGLERVGDISDADAVAEGFTDKAAFLAAFASITGKTDMGVWVWALTFQLL